MTSEKQVRDLAGNIVRVATKTEEDERPSGGATPDLATVLAEGADADGVTITGLGAPSDPSDAARLQDVGGGGLPTGWTQDESDPATVDAHGGSLKLDSGGGGIEIGPYAIDMNTGYITDLGDPTDPGDAATKGYVDGLTAPTLADVLGFGADAGAVAISNLADPSDAQDAATKQYVDDVTAGAGVTGQVFVSDGVSAGVWGGLIIAAEVPTAAPDGNLPIAYDTTAVSGGTYLWNGAAWVKVATIL